MVHCGTRMFRFTIVLYLEQQSQLARPPNQNDTLHRCLTQASKEISSAIVLAEYATIAPAGASTGSDAEAPVDMEAPNNNRGRVGCNQPSDSPLKSTGLFRQQYATPSPTVQHKKRNAN